MKKTISLIILTLASAFAFAITDAQKSEFIEMVKSDVKGGGEFANTVEVVAKTPIAQTIAAWAKTEPESFHQWLNDETKVTWKYRNATIWVVRKAVNKSFDAFSLQDAVINNFAETFNKAYREVSAYEKCREANFEFYGARFGNNAIFILSCKRYADPLTALKHLPDSEIAKNFGTFLKSITRTKLNSKDAYELYCRISRDFAQYKDVSEVKSNWETLQADKNEAFMAYYADQKLENLNK